MIRAFLKYWLPVVLWMALIFSASGDRSSGQRSSRIIGPIVRWLIPNISQKNLDAIVHTARKTAHVTEYAILALLLFRALGSARRTDQVGLGPKVGRGVLAEPLAGQSGQGACRAVASERRPVLAEPPSFPWRTATLAFAISALYAITDEFHQTLVPSRQGQVQDVFIDSLGAALGLLILWLVRRWRKRG